MYIYIYIYEKEKKIIYVFVFIEAYISFLFSFFVFCNQSEPLERERKIMNVYAYNLYVFCRYNNCLSSKCFYFSVEINND